MADYGHQETDKRLELMEKRVVAIYKQASEEMREKLAKWYKDFERLDKQKADLVEKGELPKAEYLAWRKRKMVESGRLKALVDTLTEDYVNSDRIAMQIVRGDLTDVYALNANYAAYKIEQDANVNLSWTLYDHSTVERMIREDPEILPLPSVNVPLDERWNRQYLNIAITQGILQGESIPHIGDRLQRILGMDRTAAIRSARTATTAAECAGRIDTYKYAQSIGIEMQQEWVATLDDRTRHEHRILDGQRVDIGEAFEVDGASIRYPGDPQAPGYLIYNCRCTVIGAIKGLEDDDSDDHRKHMIGTTYEEWKAGKEQESVEKSSNNDIMIVKNAIISGDVSTSINPQKQNRHIKGSSGYIPGRSYIYGGLEDAQKLVNKLSCTGSPVISKSGEWQKKERVSSDSVIGVYINPKTKTESETTKAMIIYSNSGTHIVPRKE
uniref:Minor capsid protein n=1 Tax=Siphoviridae sp. ctgEn20 TaxID=2825606 RepID=A0A8S5P6H1_9CAUD|nr:MAG TPA: minor capsid protein [Siphoviridae sp. ctgEn20]